MFIANSGLYLNTANPVATAFTAENVFFINLVLAFCAAVALTTSVVLFKKTKCARKAGIAASSVLGAALCVFVVQLVLYALHVSMAEYAVYACFAVVYAAFVIYAVYCGMLMRNSYKALCVITAISCLLPPLGALMGILLSYKIKRDSTVKKLVFNGYAYTYAALCAFSEEYDKAEFIDTADEAEPEKLDKKQIKLKLKELKKNAATAEGMFDYAAAIVGYDPSDYAAALKLMRKAAERDYAPALFNLGYYYETGTFVKRDDKKAREYYEKAKAGGDKDSEFRLIMMDLKSGNNLDTAVTALTARADGGDMYSKYNLAVCRELGIGCDSDADGAFALYVECANADFMPAERRIFAMAIREMNAPSLDGLFDKLTQRAYKPAEFAVMIRGLIDIKNRLAADASDKFLLAVKLRGRWEGIARCLVGTLYVDRGKLREDRYNGAEYVKSALGLWQTAAEVYAIIPKPKAPKTTGADNKSAGDTNAESAETAAPEPVDTESGTDGE